MVDASRAKRTGSASWCRCSTGEHMLAARRRYAVGMTAWVFAHLVVESEALAGVAHAALREGHHHVPRRPQQQLVSLVRKEDHALESPLCQALCQQYARRLRERTSWGQRTRPQAIRTSALIRYERCDTRRVSAEVLPMCDDWTSPQDEAFDIQRARPPTRGLPSVRLSWARLQVADPGDERAGVNERVVGGGGPRHCLQQLERAPPWGDGAQRGHGGVRQQPQHLAVGPLLVLAPALAHTPARARACERRGGGSVRTTGSRVSRVHNAQPLPLFGSGRDRFVCKRISIEVWGELRLEPGHRQYSRVVPTEQTLNPALARFTN
eukprot:9501365-Pyramimonas_sp.AAC.1